MSIGHGSARIRNTRTVSPSVVRALADEAANSVAAIPQVWAVPGLMVGVLLGSFLKKGDENVTDQVSKPVDAVPRETVVGLSVVEDMPQESRDQEPDSMINNSPEADKDDNDVKMTKLEEDLRESERRMRQLETQQQDFRQQVIQLEKDLANKARLLNEMQDANELIHKEYAVAIEQAEYALQVKQEIEKSILSLGEEKTSLEQEIIQGRMERESLKFKILECQKAESDAQNRAQLAETEKVAAEESLVRMARNYGALEQQMDSTEKQLQSAYADQNGLMARCEDLISQNESLARYSEEMKASLEEEVSKEHLGRVAAEKALHSSEMHIEHLVKDLKVAQTESEEVRNLLEKSKEQMSSLEQDVSMASRDAKESLHREMQALAEVERQKEAYLSTMALNEKLKSKIAELGEEITQLKSPPKKRPGRPRKNQVAEQVQVEVVGPSAEATIRKAEEAATEAKKRSYEIRAEAALLVETVEDRAYELIENAQKEVAELKAELERRNGDTE
eukprot:jgi/Picsp_1/835/NSC_04323-R1_---NA---